MDEEVIAVVNGNHAERTAEQPRPVKGKKDNPIAVFLARINAAARKELPIIGVGAITMAIICILVSIQYISVEFMVIMALGTIIKTAFQAGMVWAQVNGRKEK